MKYLLLLLVSFVPILADSMFIKVNSAPFLHEPTPSSEKLDQIPKGKEVIIESFSGLYAKVSISGKSGYISRLHLSVLPPNESGPMLRSELSIQKNLRDRPSDFTHTLASRGLMGSETLEGSSSSLGFESLLWLENLLQ
jgi:hypothetical protein